VTDEFAGYVPKLTDGKDAVVFHPVSCPDCGCFGVPKTEGSRGRCMQCGWEGDTGWKLPDDFPKNVYVEVKPVESANPIWECWSCQMANVGLVCTVCGLERYFNRKMR
jgi:hypothetical protein